MGKSITMVCTLSPRAGKLDRVKEILISLAKNVHEHEKGCTKYLVLEQRSSDADRPDMVLIEEWESQEVLDQHHKTKYLKETHDLLKKEDLVVDEELIKAVDQVYGFVRA